MRIFPIVASLASASATTISFSQLQFKDSIHTVHNALRGPSDESFFNQRLDHFDGMSSELHFQQKFFYHDYSKADNAPLFLYIGGEAPISGLEIKSGMFSIMAEKYGAHSYVLEHRFYGGSFPTSDHIMNSETLKFHNTQQALADLATFIAAKKTHDDQVVIVFGCSYPGSLAAYVREMYPHLVTGAIASSAPVLAKADFTEYDNVIVEALEISPSGKECLANIQAATAVAEKHLLVGSEVNARQFLDSVNCADFTMENEMDRISGLYILADNVAFSVQYNKNGDYINHMCNIMNGNTTVDEEVNLSDDDKYITRLRAFNKFAFRATGSTCEGSRMTSFSEENSLNNRNIANSRSWLYQCCTNYGYWQTAPTDGHESSRSSAINLKYHLNLCDNLYPLKNGSKWSNQDTHANALYGGRHGAINRFLSATQIHFTNGQADPWKALSITDADIKNANVQSNDLQKRGLTTFEIENGSHCNDFHIPNPSEPSQVEAIEKIDAAIQKFFLTLKSATKEIRI